MNFVRTDNKGVPVKARRFQYLYKILQSSNFFRTISPFIPLYKHYTNEPSDTMTILANTFMPIFNDTGLHVNL